MSGLTNDYLEKIGKKLLKNNFLGVFPADGYVNTSNKETFSVIFNTGKANTKGLHFVAVYVTKTIVHYFDSFGNKKIQPDIVKFIRNIKKTCHMNCEQIQDNNSNFCGFFALAFLLWKKKYHKMNNFYKMFNKFVLKRNDKIVIKYILKEIPN